MPWLSCRMQVTVSRRVEGRKKGRGEEEIGMGGVEGEGEDRREGRERNFSYFCVM